MEKVDPSRKIFFYRPCVLAMLAGDLKAQAVAYRRRYGHDPEEICADKIYRKRSNRAFCQRYGIRLSNPYLGWPMNDPE
jgi:hypothetical protein